MSSDRNIEQIFREHSFEEIESVRDNLANEIENRTNQLKSIVKEKYRDIVETSDKIQSIRSKLGDVDRSLWSLNHHIVDFYIKLREDSLSKSNGVKTEQDSSKSKLELQSTIKEDEHIIKKLINLSSSIWLYCDAGDLDKSFALLKEARCLISSGATPKTLIHKRALENMTAMIDRTEIMMKRNIWYQIRSAGPDQVNVIDGSGKAECFQMCLEACLGFLVNRLKSQISDLSNQAQIRRYRPHSYFNAKTNQIDTAIDLLNPPLHGYVCIPNETSPELGEFLFEVCKVMNKIAGFNLTRESILVSLKITIDHIVTIYASLITSLESIKSEMRRKRRVQQLHFDLLYVRLLLNNSNSTELIESLDPQISKVIDKFEEMLDKIELYMRSEALHANVVELFRATSRLYGLLIPHLE